VSSIHLSALWRVFARGANVAAEAVPGIFRAQGRDGRRVTGAENSHEIRIGAHEMRQPSRPNPILVGLRMTPCETKPRLDLGDLGAAHGNAMRRRTIELDHRAVTFLANEGDMRDRDDMAAVHPDE
jgi:hypothetical protein